MPAVPGAYLAIDIGASKLDAGIVTTAGELRARSRRPTPPGADATVLLDAVVGAAAAALADAPDGVLGVGVGCVGPMDEETVSPLNIPGWRRFPLRHALEERLGLPVALDNDAKALALGEGWRGAAAGSRNFLAMVVSTGVGGGIVLDGRLLSGRLGNAGHIGHVLVEPDGRPCRCGARGCLEAEASGTALAAITGEAPEHAPPELRARCGTLVGRAVASVANLLDLDLALVGGSVALGFGAPFFEAARAELAARARLDFARSCVLGPVGLGEEGPLVGAAAVAMQSVREQGSTTP